jgi:hypothetical protein
MGERSFANPDPSEVCTPCWNTGVVPYRGPCPHRRPHPCGCPHLRAGDVCAAHEAEVFQRGNLERLEKMSDPQRVALGDAADSATTAAMQVLRPGVPLTHARLHWSDAALSVAHFVGVSR